MKYILLSLLLCISAAGQANTAMKQLAHRLLGERSANIEFVPVADTIERYRVSASDIPGNIRIEGSTTSAMAVGLNNYLRQVCNTDVSWYLSSTVALPDTLPVPVVPLEGAAQVPSRFFLNYCTYGYSFPYWGWNDWERMIDWMAINGVNLPLAIAGQEAVWQRVWRSFGLTDNEIREYFSGPAFLPWHRMLNVDSWHGPLPQSYIDGQEELQKKIVERMRALGMKPVLPAFAGHVPKALARVRPDVKINPMSAWGGLDPEQYRSYFIDPDEQLFDTIQQRFLNEQAQVFGTDHIYGVDPFNEIEVPSWEEEYLRNASARIFSTLQKADPQAQWLQMAWMFYYMSKQWTPERIKAFTEGVDPERLIFLDYYCDFKPLWTETDAFHNRKFIWCYLGNFGGNTFLAGNMKEVDNRITRVLSAGLNNLEGLGGTLEGLDVNPQMHAYVLDRAWLHGSQSGNPDEWIQMWGNTRGGATDTTVTLAWKRLNNEVYTRYCGHHGTLVNARPCLKGYNRWVTNNKINYSNDSLAIIWKTLIDAKADNPPHTYDVVNIGRQVLGNYFPILRDRFTQAYEKCDTVQMLTAAEEMDTLILELDSLLSCTPEFSLAKWISDARSWGTTPEEADYYETDARVLITTWGQAAGGLNDYANRDLCGLTGDFYRQRWKMFTTELINRVKARVSAGKGNKTAGNEDDSLFLGKDDPFYNILTQWEWEWHQKRQPIPYPTPTDARALSRRLYKKYFE